MAFMGWTVPIIWAALVLFAALTVLLLYLGLFQDRSRGRPRCPKCWYNMTGAPSLVCPECGHDARNPRRLHRTRRRRWAIVLAVLTAFCCYCSWLVRVRFVELKEPIAVALRPTSYLLATLPKAQVAQVFILRTRAGRFGFWPWESELLLLTLDSVLYSQGPSSDLALSLLSVAAKTSDRALNRLVDLRERFVPTSYNPVFRLIAEHAGRLRDDQLAAVLDSAMARSTHYNQLATDSILTEMTRRNRPAFKEQVASWAANPPVDLTFKTKQNLELVTTLRRMDGKPDPLHLLIRGPGTIRCTTDILPTIEVSIENSDVNHEAVGFQVGGDYSSGRQARWRFEVRDERGHLLPTRPAPTVPISVMRSFKMLEFGQSYVAKLPMEQYLPPLPPGRYQVTVLYHNSQTIADMEDTSGLIVFRSDPFELIVRPDGAGSRPASRGQ